MSKNKQAKKEALDENNNRRIVNGGIQAKI